MHIVNCTRIVDYIVKLLYMYRSPDPSHVEIKRLDLHNQCVKFLLDRFGNKKDSEVVWKSFIEKNGSAGLYVDGLLVCGTILRNFGVLGSLYTVPEHKRKGYAVLTMQFAFKELAKNDIIPATTVVVRNKISQKLHEKLGCKYGGMVDYIVIDHEAV